MEKILSFKTLNRYNGYYFNGYMRLLPKAVIAVLSMPEYKRILKLIHEDTETEQENIRLLSETAQELLKSCSDAKLAQKITKKLSLLPDVFCRTGLLPF